MSAERLRQLDDAALRTVRRRWPSFLASLDQPQQPQPVSRAGVALGSLAVLLGVTGLILVVLDYRNIDNGEKWPSGITAGAIGALVGAMIALFLSLFASRQRKQ